MRHFLYTIFDTASGRYERPFAGMSDAQAIRSFGDICRDTKHPYGMHPEDYMLYRIGTFDDNTSEVVPEDATVIAKGHELVARAEVVDLDKDGYPMNGGMRNAQ